MKKQDAAFVLFLIGGSLLIYLYVRLQMLLSDSMTQDDFAKFMDDIEIEDVTGVPYITSPDDDDDMEPEYDLMA